MSDEKILAELGERFERERLNRDLSQQALADRSGISLRTVKNVEAGKPCSLPTMIALLRGLDLLSRLEQLLPEPALSPIQLAKLKGRQRQRASRKPPSDQSGDTVRESSHWQWKE